MDSNHRPLPCQFPQRIVAVRQLTRPSDMEEQSLRCLHDCSPPFTCAKAILTDSKRERQGYPGCDTNQDTSPVAPDMHVSPMHFQKGCPGVAQFLQGSTDFLTVRKKFKKKSAMEKGRTLLASLISQNVTRKKVNLGETARRPSKSGIRRLPAKRFSLVYEHAFCSRVQYLAYLFRMTAQNRLRSAAYCNKSVSGILVADEQASEVLPSRILESVIECTPENGGQHVS